MPRRAGVEGLRDAGGFTLIELMIVILIVGVLVGIAVPVFINARANASERTCQANVRILKSACGAFNVSYGTYPSDVGDLVPGFLEKTPTCPEVGRTDSYRFEGGGGDTPPQVSCVYHGTF